MCCETTKALALLVLQKQVRYCWAYVMNYSMQSQQVHQHTLACVDSSRRTWWSSTRRCLMVFDIRRYTSLTNGSVSSASGSTATCRLTQSAPTAIVISPEFNSG